LSRLTALFARLEKTGRKALIPYIVAGDPNPRLTVALMHELVSQGADIVEIGVPFSDPMAEGPVIQLAHERALAHSVSLSMVIDLVAEFRQQDQDTAVVLMGYANPIERMGYTVFAERAAKAGVDGLLTVDMPPEEAEEPTRVLRKAGIDNIFLLAPTTSEARIAKIASLASGYLYCVALKGVTGAGNLDIASVSNKLASIKKITDLPITVGFGIKDGASAAALAPFCAGVVVGSALIERMVMSVGLPESDQIKNVAGLITEMRAAIDAK
jgi:tryptophan synthase alpha chain